MNLKVKNDNFRVLEKIIFVIMVMIAAFLVYDIYYRQKPMYCHFEADLTDDANFPIDACFNMKVIANKGNMSRIDFTRFATLNYTSYLCSEMYSDMPSCNQSNLYFSYYPLEMFSNGTVNGYILFEYFIDYFVTNDTYTKYYEEALMMEEYDSAKELHIRFKKFKGR